MPLDRCLWIDAISINQNDNSERTYQVKLMPQNYANASLVEIYIGEAAGNSERLPTRFGAMKRIRGQSGDQFSSSASYQMNSSHSRMMDEETFAALQAFFRRPWFTRVWIIQEAVLARNSRFLCGNWRSRGLISVKYFLGQCESFHRKLYTTMKPLVYSNSFW
jgi:Heterokaryon incompatibility protein (HET)